MKTIISLVLVLSSQVFAAADTTENLMPEVTHSSDSMRTYSTPKGSLGRSEVERDEVQANEEKATQTAQLTKKQ